MTALSRRHLLGAAMAGAALPWETARAQAAMTAAVYPGGWDEALRAVLAPRLRETQNINVAFEPLFAVDQIAKARAARGIPPFDVFVLDPGPRVSGIDLGLFEAFDPAKLSNRAQLPNGYSDAHGAAVAAQVVGIAYNPTKVAKPKGWADLFKPEYASKLGLTGFQTTFGTISLIEMAKLFGGSETNVEPLFAELRKIKDRGRGGGGARGDGRAVPAGPDRRHVHQHLHGDVAEVPWREHRLRRARDRRRCLRDDDAHRQGQPRTSTAPTSTSTP